MVLVVGVLKDALDDALGAPLDGSFNDPFDRDPEGAFDGGLDAILDDALDWNLDMDLVGALGKDLGEVLEGVFNADLDVDFEGALNVDLNEALDVDLDGVLNWDLDVDVDLERGLDEVLDEALDGLLDVDFHDALDGIFEEAALDEGFLARELLAEGLFEGFLAEGSLEECFNTGILGELLLDGDFDDVFDGVLGEAALDEGRLVWKLEAFFEGFFAEGPWEVFLDEALDELLDTGFCDAFAGILEELALDEGFLVWKFLNEVFSEGIFAEEPLEKCLDKGVLGELPLEEFFDPDFDDALASVFKKVLFDEGLLVWRLLSEETLEECLKEGLLEVLALLEVFGLLELSKCLDILGFLRVFRPIEVFGLLEVSETFRRFVELMLLEFFDAFFGEEFLNELPLELERLRLELPDFGVLFCAAGFGDFLCSSTLAASFLCWEGNLVEAFDFFCRDPTFAVLLRPSDFGLLRSLFGLENFPSPCSLGPGLLPPWVDLGT